MNVKGVENAQEYTPETTEILSKYFIDDDNNNIIFYGKSKYFYY